MADKNSKNCSVFNLKSPLHGFFKDAFSKKCDKKKAKNADGMVEKKVDEAEIADAVPFRLEKNNIINKFAKFVPGVQYASAMKSKKTAVPNWGNALTYPFVSINGISPTGPKASAEQHERNFLNDFYKKNKAASDKAIRTASVNGLNVPPDAVMLFHKVDISNVKPADGSNRADPLHPGDNKTSASTYARISPQYLVQQCFDLDRDGSVILNPNKKDGVIVRPVARDVSRSLCKLSRLTPGDIRAVYGFQGDATEKIASFLRSNAAFITRGKTPLKVYHYDPVTKQPKFETINARALTDYGNSEYCDFEKFFQKHGCLDGEQLKLDRLIDKIRSGEVDTDDFVENFMMRHWLMSAPEKTYVWVSVDNTAREPKCDEKDLEIAKKAIEGNFSEKFAEKVDESTKTNNGGEFDSCGDWSGAFFEAMKMAYQKSLKKVFSFATIGSAKTIVPFSSIKSGTASDKSVREFICVDKVLDDAPDMDYRPIFADERFKDMFAADCPKVFACKKISGRIYSFPMDSVLEKDRAEHGESDFELIDSYIKEHGVEIGNSMGFFITMMKPKDGKGDFMFFTGYGSPKNPLTNRYGEPPTGIENVVLSDSNNLVSAMWYNTETSKSAGKIEMPTHAKASRSDAEGMTIGYKDSERVGDNPAEKEDHSGELKTTVRK